jgi:hypothetical protein
MENIKYGLQILVENPERRMQLQMPVLDGV